MQDDLNYELRSEIRRNHFAVLYNAYNIDAKLDVVIVELHPNLPVDADGWGKIWRQIDTLREAHLDNTVSILDLNKDRRWVIVEKMGSSLSEQIVKQSLPPALVRNLLRQILAALASLHRLGIIHGDVKPKSLLDNRGEDVQLDFSPGLILAGQIPRRQFGFKSIAPETLKREFGEIGPSVDLYCLGLTALELLTGPDFDPLFPDVFTGGDTEQGWIQWHTSGDFRLPSVRDIVPDVPDDLVRVIDRLLCKRVGDRYGSVGEVLTDLDDATLEFIPGEDEGTTTAVANAPVVFQAAASTEPMVKLSKRGNFSITRHDADNKTVVNPSSPNRLAAIGSNDVRDEAQPSATGLKVTVLIAICLLVGCLIAGGIYLVFDRDRPIDVPNNDAERTPRDELRRVGSTNTSVGRSASQVHGAQLAKSANISEAYGRLPEGLLAADGAEIDDRLQLPRLIVAEKLRRSDLVLQFVLIVPQEFPFGVEAGWKRVTGELPASVKSIDQPYYISLTEITNEQYDQFFQSVGAVVAGDRWRQARGNLGDDAARHPVVNVGVGESRAFCRWISSGGRLPTEFEWECAARGGTRRRFPWTDDTPPDATRCNLMFGFDELPTTVSVDAMPAGTTPTGLRHMLGNVAEWCGDLYTAGHAETPSDPGIGIYHVIRGGSFKTRDKNDVRLSTRANAKPDGADDIGFRVVVPVTPPVR